MDFFGGFSECTEALEVKESKESKFSKESNEKFDKLMGDDTLPETNDSRLDSNKINSVVGERKFDQLFDDGDFFKRDVHVRGEGVFIENQGTPFVDEVSFPVENNTQYEGLGKTHVNEDIIESDFAEEPDYKEQRESNSSYEHNGNTYETDDNGQTYKKNGEIIGNNEYTVHKSTYKTDEHGNKISCDAKPEYTEEGSRNMKEQKEAGGEERQEDDDGGHIIARVLGGAEGDENLVPMRRTINRGDYKRMENEISKALQEGKEVTVHIDIDYDEDSSRPSKIYAEYTIDGKTTICTFDNNEGSTDLLDTVHDTISDEDYDRLQELVDDMKADDCNPSITSVKVEYDENNQPTKVTVGILDESTNTKSYKEYSPR